MIGLYILSILIAFIYIFIITHFFTAWGEIDEWTCDERFTPETSVTIIIPYRNEEKEIKACIDSVLANQFPKRLYEIIAVDDHSEDHSLPIVDGIEKKNIQSLSLSGTSGLGKKAAIELGISKANGKLIITLDADCRVGENWLINIISFYEYHKSPFIVGMVALEGEKNILESFQILDTCGTMGVHGAGIHNKTHYLANGANLIFEKYLFEKVNPYDGNKAYSSGDDIFFINQVAEIDKAKVRFLKNKDSVVVTKALQSWKGLWAQRKRWAGKTKAYSKGAYTWLTGMIWLFCLSIVVNLLLIPVTGGVSFFIALTQLLIKGIMDFLYLQNMAHYFDKQEHLKYFIPSFFVHLVYILFAGVIALQGNKSYIWKGRKVR